MQDWSACPGSTRNFICLPEGIARDFNIAKSEFSILILFSMEFVSVFLSGLQVGFSVFFVCICPFLLLNFDRYYYCSNDFGRSWEVW